MTKKRPPSKRAKATGNGPPAKAADPVDLATSRRRAEQRGTLYVGPPRPQAVARAEKERPPPRPAYSDRFMAILHEGIDNVLKWVGRLVHQRQADVGEPVSEDPIRVTEGTRCPRCSGPASLRTMTESESEAIEKAALFEKSVGPMGGRRCTSDRCGVLFLEMASFTGQGR